MMDARVWPDHLEMDMNMTDDQCKEHLRNLIYDAENAVRDPKAEDRPGRRWKAEDAVGRLHSFIDEGPGPADEEWEEAWNIYDRLRGRVDCA